MIASTAAHIIAAFAEDRLRGDADVGRLVERAQPFGLDMAWAHQVALTLRRVGSTRRSR